MLTSKIVRIPLSIQPYNLLLSQTSWHQTGCTHPIVYPKGWDNSYASVSSHNFHLVFTYKQIAASLRATILTTPTLHTAMILDQNQLYSNILATLSFDSSISNYFLYSEEHWSKDNAGFLRLDNRMYVPDNANLHLQVLQYHHDHVLAGHLGQNKILELVQRYYTGPNIHGDIQKFCKSCVTCMRSKPQCHSVTNFIWPYLHQIFIDFHSLNGYKKALEKTFR